MSSRGASRRGRSGRAGVCLAGAALAAACLAAIPTARLRAQTAMTGVISGRVTDTHGQPQQLLVHLLAQADVPAGEVFTDSNGNFAFSALPNGYFFVVVEAKGFRPVRQTVVLDQRTDPRAQVTIVLEPLQKEMNEPSPLIAGSPKSHELSAKKPAQPPDPRVLREYEKGYAKQREGNFSAAFAHYQKALKIDPDYYAAQNNLGILYERQREYAQAEAAFQKSLKINPDDGEAYINLGHVFYEEGKYQPARERLEEGLKRSPESAVGHFFLGSTYLKLGDLEKAEPSLKTASTLDPAGMSRAHLQLANLYLKLLNPGAAGSELESYLQSNPFDPQAPAIKKMLANIQSHSSN